MNWGHGIGAALAAFIIMIISFVWRASGHRTDLIAEDYYVRELAHQDKIDRLKNAGRMGIDIRTKLTEEGVLLHLPSSVKGNGSVYLFRASDKELDRTYRFDHSSPPTLIIPPADVLSGTYRMEVSWTDPKGKDYLVAQDLLIP